MCIRDSDDAVRMLTALSGREHIVYTGVAVLRGVRAKGSTSRMLVTPVTNISRRSNPAPKMCIRDR